MAGAEGKANGTVKGPDQATTSDYPRSHSSSRLAGLAYIERFEHRNFVSGDLTSVTSGCRVGFPLDAGPLNRMLCGAEHSGKQVAHSRSSRCDSRVGTRALPVLL